MLIERWAPLRSGERRFLAEWLAFLADVAAGCDLPAADLRAWERLRHADAPDHLVDHPAFYACEGQTVAAGVVAPRA